MRVRFDPVSALHVADVARTEGRSAADAARVLIAEAIRQRKGQPQKLPIIDDDDVGDYVVRGSSVAAHVHGVTLAAMSKIANSEDRSMSWVMRRLLNEALYARGLLPRKPQPTATA